VRYSGVSTPTICILGRSPTPTRLFAILVIGAIGSACGGQSPTHPTSLAAIANACPTSGELAINITDASATLRLNNSGGPGLIDYQLNLNVTTKQWPSTDVTVRRLEQWALGADGSEYNHTIDETPKKVGCSSRVVSYGGYLYLLDQEFTARPVASIYRAMAEYTYDSGSPAEVQVVTAQRRITADFPTPLMNGVTMSADAPFFPQGHVSARPITIVASGTGGIAPYEYQFRVANALTRDWSTEPKFVWTPNPPNPGSAGYVTFVSVLARSAGRTAPEVTTGLSFDITN